MGGWAGGRPKAKLELLGVGELLNSPVGMADMEGLPLFQHNQRPSFRRTSLGASFQFEPSPQKNTFLKMVS